jgi:hypothetical protein
MLLFGLEGLLLVSFILPPQNACGSFMKRDLFSSQFRGCKSKWHGTGCGPVADNGWWNMCGGRVTSQARELREWAGWGLLLSLQPSLENYQAKGNCLLSSDPRISH